jgi:hypothetical protein
MRRVVSPLCRVFEDRFSAKRALYRVRIADLIFSEARVIALRAVPLPVSFGDEGHRVHVGESCDNRPGMNRTCAAPI